MLRVRVVAIGSLKEGYLRDAVSEYLKRLQRFVTVEVVEIPETNPIFEGSLIASKVRGRAILFDVGGTQMTSEQLADRISALKLMTSELTLIIGGSEGVSDAVRSLADETISFSKMTFPHQLFRVMLLEQLYRAEMIQANMKYHK